METLKTDSSAISEITNKGDTLEIEFTSGDRYRYYGKEAMTAWEKLKLAHQNKQSIGRTFHQLRPSLKTYNKV